MSATCTTTISCQCKILKQYEWEGEKNQCDQWKENKKNNIKQQLFSKFKVQGVDKHLHRSEIQKVSFLGGTYAQSFRALSKHIYRNFASAYLQNGALEFKKLRVQNEPFLEENGFIPGR